MTAFNQQAMNYIEEYQNTIVDMKTTHVNWEQVAETLVKEHEWTEEGASHLVHLARDYGAFVLTHALALATILKQEDGQLGL